MNLTMMSSLAKVVGRRLSLAATGSLLVANAVGAHFFRSEISPELRALRAA